MTSEEMRERLFDLYAANLSLCMPEMRDTFLCPFCLAQFTKDAVRGKDPKVILAHCVPDSLRGKMTTLACAACDNNAGRDIDIHLINRLRTTSFFGGHSPASRRVWFHTDGQRARADYRIMRGPEGDIHHEFRLDEASSPPGQPEAMRQAMESGEAFRHPMRVTQRGQMSFSMDLSRVALLRAGYLLAFRSLGYSYILHPNLNRLRAQFQEPQEAVIPGRPVVQVGPAMFSENAVCLITSPRPSLAFLAVLRCRADEVVSVFGVILPGLGRGDESVYEAFAADQERNDSATMTFKNLSELLVPLDDPQAVSLPYALWGQCVAGQAEAG